MKAPQTLRRPANWQDFESLCKKLWGEIWNCAEIHKNGRLGQDQSGVDVYGIPSGENEYYGIQCKGKSEYNDEQYTHPQFTEDEILKEIEKAKTFDPLLKKFYFATTALNDAKVQAFIRKKNLEHINQGLFEIHIFCWEEIVDLIDENKRTHDYYLKSQNFKSNQSVSVTFEDEITEITVTPKFAKKIIFYNHKDKSAGDAMDVMYFSAMRQQQHIIKAAASLSWALNRGPTINRSFFDFRILVKNTGTEPIEQYKLLLEFKGNISEFADTNEKNEDLVALMVNKHKTYTTFLSGETMTGRVVPISSMLVGQDTFSSDRIYIKPSPLEKEIVIEWRLISKNFQDSGSLNIYILPEIETKREEVIIYDLSKVRKEDGEIVDYTEKKGKQ
jgi:hypothetical protein